MYPQPQIFPKLFLTKRKWLVSWLIGLIFFQRTAMITPSQYQQQQQLQQQQQEEEEAEEDDFLY